MNIEIFNITVKDGQNAELISKTENNGITDYTFKLTWTEENAKNDDNFVFDWNTPLVGIMYGWNPKCELNRCVNRGFSHMLANGSPINSFYDGHGTNKYTVALSEAKMFISGGNVIVEENGNIHFSFSLGTQQYTNKYQTELILRTDTREIPLYEAVASVAKWWEDLGIKPAAVPEAAKEPCYSFWYSYHQKINEKDVEDECRRAKELGFDICIVDDGWQTDDNSRGYAYCGDWEPCPAKFPDMAAHVKRVHDLGMKYILWYSVPFVGTYSKSYEIFKDMFLKMNGKDEYVLDPRYKEVREYLLGKYVSALRDWDLDGFKFDFIDAWWDDKKNAPYNEKMDIPSLQDAVDVLMTSVTNALKKIKPDILLEFRQFYIGPHMRRFGNMFRVADCPGNYIYNRAGVLDLRMYMGNSAVHSDMLMWHKDESAEKNALQIISIIFGVMQYSARLDSISDRVKKMSKFWLNLMKEKKDLLLNGELRSYDPHLTYTWAQSVKDDECFAAVYTENMCINPELKNTVYIANGTTGNKVVCELSGSYNIEIFDCCGEKNGEQNFRSSGKEIISINIPVGGLAVLKNHN